MKGLQIPLSLFLAILLGAATLVVAFKFVSSAKKSVEKLDVNEESLESACAYLGIHPRGNIPDVPVYEVEVSKVKEISEAFKSMRCKKIAEELKGAASTCSSSTAEWCRSCSNNKDKMCITSGNKGLSDAIRACKKIKDMIPKCKEEYGALKVAKCLIEKLPEWCPS